MTCPPTEASRCTLPSPLLDSANGAVTQEENLLTILDIGDDALVALLHLIRSSRATIEIQTFIWADDAVGHLLFRELLGAARRGVRVRIIADQMFSSQPVEVLAWIATAHHNLSLKLYNPVGGRGDTSFIDHLLQAPVDFKNVNNRMHNKLVVVDGIAGITGGRNFTSKYYDRGLLYNYLDRDVLVLGPTAGEMQASFEEFWNHPLSVSVDQLLDVHNRLFSDGVQTAIPIPATPDPSVFQDVRERALNVAYITDRFLDTAYQVDRAVFQADNPGKGLTANSKPITTSALRESIANAKHSVVIQSPYFVLSEPAFQTFASVREAYPDVQYIMSTNSLASTDAYYVYGLSFKRKKAYVKDLGFRVFELKPQPGDLATWLPRHSPVSETVSVDYAATQYPGSETNRAELMPLAREGPRVGIHQKSIVIDERIAVIGSHNFDPRSAAINTEVTLVVWDRPFALALRRSILRATEPQNSWVVARQQQLPVLGHISGMFGSISRALPLFDLWPFRYTSSFELRMGQDPVLPNDATFYERYEDVGQFPGVALSPKEIATRLVSAFGGIIEPQM